jgi:predicted ribosomally synthesized peptide with SipW-like signal peptide
MRSIVSRRVIIALAVCIALSVGGGVALAAFTDSTATSGSSFAAAATFPVLSVSIPDVEQTAQVGAQMRVTNGVWSPTPGAFTYGWLRCNAAGASCGSIAGATAATYTPVVADVGFTLRGAVTASGGPALSTEATQVVKAANLGPVIAGGTTVATVAANMPSITGTLQVGQVLTSTNGTWAGAAVAITRQWLRCSATGDQCVAIAGATAGTYTAVAADRNLRLRVRVTATRSAVSNFVLTLDVGPVS